MRTVAGTALLGAALLVWGARPAKAQDQDSSEQRAQVLVERAAELGRKGQLVEAIATFKEAEALHPRAIHDCNIGLAYLRLEKWPQAQLFLSRCRERWSQEQTAPIDNWVNQRLRETISKLESGDYAAIAVRSSPAQASLQLSSFADDEIFLAPRVFWLPTGQVELVANLTGHHTHRQVLQVVRGQQQDIHLTLPAIQAEATPPVSDAIADDQLPAPPPVIRSADTETAQPLQLDRSASNASNDGPGMWPWLLTGSGFALVGGGVLFHRSALGAKNEAERFAPGDDFDTWNDRFATRRAVTYGLYGLGGVALGAGLYFLLTDEGDEQPTAWLQVHSGDSHGVALHGTWQ